LFKDNSIVFIGLAGIVICSQSNESSVLVKAGQQQLFLTLREHYF
jgi:hypothetical protein